MSQGKVWKIERLREAMAGIETVLDILDDQVGLDPEGPLHSAIAQLIAVATLATAESVGVDREAFDWFVFESHFGREALACQRPGGEEVVIDGIESFLAFEGVEG